MVLTIGLSRQMNLMVITNELVTLAQQLSGKPYQEVLRIADELYALRPKALKGGLERK